MGRVYYLCRNCPFSSGCEVADACTYVDAPTKVFEDELPFDEEDAYLAQQEWDGV